MESVHEREDFRRIIKFGNSSFVVSLPSSWIKDNGIKKGDLVNIRRNGNGEIAISPKDNNLIEEKSGEISTDDKTFEDINRLIILHYINGYKTLTFIGKDLPSKSKRIIEFLSNLSGFEIVEKNKEKIVVNDIMNIGDIPLDKFVKRLDNCIRAMFEILVTSIKRKRLTKNDLNEIVIIDNDINRNYFVIWKVLKVCLKEPRYLEKIKLSQLNVYNTWWLGVSLEHMGDELKRIAGIVCDKKFSAKDTEDLTYLLSLFKTLYADSMKAYYASDIKISQQVTGRKSLVRNKLREYSNRPDISKTVGRVVERFRTLHGQIHSISRNIPLSN